MRRFGKYTHSIVYYRCTHLFSEIECTQFFTLLERSYRIPLTSRFSSHKRTNFSRMIRNLLTSSPDP